MRANQNQPGEGAFARWVQILVVPLTAAILGGCFTIYATEREYQESMRTRVEESEESERAIIAEDAITQRALDADAAEKERDRDAAAEERKSNLTLQYTEVFIVEYKNREDPDVLALLQLIAGIMTSEELIGADAMNALAFAEQHIASSGTTEFTERPSDESDCRDRSNSQVCIGFSDGFVWLVEDSIVGWQSIRVPIDGVEQDVEIAIGVKAQYFHVLKTKSVKEVQQLSTAPVQDAQR